MTLIQIFLLIFVVFALVRVWTQFQRKMLSRSDVFVWTVVWFGIAFVTLLPNAATWIANFVGVGRGTDLVLYIAVAVLFSALFRSFARIHQLERSLTEFVRKQAIDNPSVPKEKNKE